MSKLFTHEISLVSNLLTRLISWVNSLLTRLNLEKKIVLPRLILCRLLRKTDTDTARFPTLDISVKKNFSPKFPLLDLTRVEAQDQVYEYVRYDWTLLTGKYACDCIGSLAIQDTQAEFQHFRNVV